MCVDSLIWQGLRMDNRRAQAWITNCEAFWVICVWAHIRIEKQQQSDRRRLWSLCECFTYVLCYLLVRCYQYNCGVYFDCWEARLNEFEIYFQTLNDLVSTETA